MLVLLALVPQTLASYEALLLALVVRTRWEAITFVLLGAVMLPFLARDGMAFEEMIARNATVILVALYLPCVAMVLRRTNVQEFT